MSVIDFGAYWHRCRTHTEEVLEGVFESRADIPERLLEAMRYSTLGGGKRLRAMLVYAAGEHMKGCSPASSIFLDHAAAAVELVHAYSLVHDDLPAMDNDDLRRGRPTCHRQFDEATAVIAGDALQTLAFELLAGDSLKSESLTAARRLRMVECLAVGAGGGGMAGGQQLDMDATGHALPMEKLMQIHHLKTGALIRASCLLGGLAAETSTETHWNALAEYGQAIGMTFQIVDDILDVTADSQTLGKPSGSDDRMQKTTFVSLLGLEEACSQRDHWRAIALKSADELGGEKSIFHQLVDFIVTREF